MCRTTLIQINGDCWRTSIDGAMAREPTSSNEYRRRANAVGKSLKARSKRGRGPLLKKQKALNDMADNQDWLDGKPKPRAEY